MEVLCRGHIDRLDIQEIGKGWRLSLHLQHSTGHMDRVLDLGHVIASIEKAEIQGGRCWYLTGHVIGQPVEFLVDPGAMVSVISIRETPGATKQGEL